MVGEVGTVIVVVAGVLIVVLVGRLLIKYIL